MQLSFKLHGEIIVPKESYKDALETFVCELFGSMGKPEDVTYTGLEHLEEQDTNLVSNEDVWLSFSSLNESKMMYVLSMSYGFKLSKRVLKFAEQDIYIVDIEESEKDISRTLF